ncbi:MAG: ABC transporter ATP-binding protein [Candidatus Dormibacteraeota bacterium]|nr:ABC transporter ATP-binding protein [Candidatus Dormibacteraeota bacterium]MBO0704706.1 ABC transporter ATP-binding protein [Candidatus Dormibacteraeota bacterium]MBO0761496.1 ABC transporter ATP-binding protein [Candidatus Dormibacteraeota bacterium]
MALLELEDVRAQYGAIRALHGVTLEVGQGAMVTVLGANGAGKTTTLRAISGMVRRTGRIQLDGKDLLRLSPEDVARLGVAHVPEGRGTLSQLSVRENLEMGGYLRRDRAAVKRDRQRIAGYFPWMEHRFDQTAATLSGGEQQMLAIGRALMMRPKLLLLDEPSLGLAPMLVREMFDIIGTINREEGLATLIVEQNASLALRAAAHAYVLEVGRVVVNGTSAELSEDESIRRSYLGY